MVLCFVKETILQQDYLGCLVSSWYPSNQSLFLISSRCSSKWQETTEFKEGSAPGQETSAVPGALVSLTQAEGLQKVLELGELNVAVPCGQLPSNQFFWKDDTWEGMCHLKMRSCLAHSSCFIKCLSIEWGHPFFVLPLVQVILSSWDMDLSTLPIFPSNNASHLSLLPKSIFLNYGSDSCQVSTESLQHS